jgi:hypothetical protein
MKSLRAIWKLFFGVLSKSKDQPYYCIPSGGERKEGKLFE